MVVAILKMADFSFAEPCFLVHLGLSAALAVAFLGGHPEVVRRRRLF